MKFDISQLTITTGYIGSLGKSWHTPTEAELEKAIIGAIEMNGWTRERVLFALETGSAVKWQKSPNYEYDHSYGMIGRKRQPKPIEMVECDCGHKVPRDQVMSVSLGTSCPDCYDRMSDG